MDKSFSNMAMAVHNIKGRFTADIADHRSQNPACGGEPTVKDAHLQSNASSDKHGIDVGSPVLQPPNIHFTMMPCKLECNDDCISAEDARVILDCDRRTLSKVGRGRKARKGSATRSHASSRTPRITKGSRHVKQESSNVKVEDDYVNARSSTEGKHILIVCQEVKVELEDEEETPAGAGCMDFAEEAGATSVSNSFTGHPRSSQRIRHAGGSPPSDQPLVQQLRNPSVSARSSATEDETQEKRCIASADSLQERSDTTAGHADSDEGSENDETPSVEEVGDSEDELFTSWDRALVDASAEYPDSESELDVEVLLLAEAQDGTEDVMLQELPVHERKFAWTSDFKTFRAQREEFTGAHGPVTPCTDPLTLFLNTWDDEIISKIVEDTNRYAAASKQLFESKPENATSRSHVKKWVPTTVSEVYLLLGIMVEQSLCSFGTEKEYWRSKGSIRSDIGVMMSYDRFVMLKKFLYFVDDDSLSPLVDPSNHSAASERMVDKVRPVIDHCLRKFQQQYTPEREIAIDESLLLWKGSLRFIQYIKTKAAKMGIKTFELCESRTGYLWDFFIHTGKPVPARGAASSTQADPWPAAGAAAATVMRLMQHHLYKGHTLYMDNYFNSPTLARFLKSRRTDCVGTVRASRKQVPEAIAKVKPSAMRTDDRIARHCGDVSVIAWKDLKKKVTMISTYHGDTLGDGRRKGNPVKKPNAVLEYNKHMGGVDLKDQHLSSFPLERKQNKVWYKKFFRRLLNVSLLNSYIIYKESDPEKPLNHRDFRYEIALKLYDSNRAAFIPSPGCSVATRKVFSPLSFHTMERIPRDTTDPLFGAKLLRICVLCSYRTRRKSVKRPAKTQFRCRICQCALCVPDCFNDWHCKVNL